MRAAFDIAAGLGRTVLGFGVSRKSLDRFGKAKPYTAVELIGEWNASNGPCAPICERR
jgi:hypothetical protein